MQCDVQNDECHINMSAVMQPPFQLWFSADQCGHLFLAPKAYKRCKEISSRRDKLFKYFQDHDMNGER